MLAEQLLPSDIARQEELDPQLEAAAELERAAHLLDLEPWIVQRLKNSERELTTCFPVERDDHAITTCAAIRVQHNSARGPYLGPMWVSPNAGLAQLRLASARRTWQCALLGVPFGGAAGAIICEPHALADREVRGAIDEFICRLAPLLGRDCDYIAASALPQRLAAWMMDSFERLGERGAMTGLPVALGGCGLDGSALGAVACIREAIGGRELRDARIAIQGFGRTGSAIAMLLHQRGARVIAVCDTSGGVMNDKGIDVAALIRHVGDEGIVFGYSDGDACSNADVLASDCNVLILAAAPRQITCGNAARVRARVVIEIADGAITPAAERELLDKRVDVIPAMLATAGEPLAAALELNRAAMPHDEVLSRMSAMTASVRQCALQRELSVREASLLLAVKTVANAIRLRRP